MQTISSNLSAALVTIDARVNPRVVVDVYELYASSYVPHADGFHPSEAIERFAAETITWNGNSYRREVISRGDISKSMGREQNNVSLTFSNVSRYMGALVQNQTLEGLFLVIRCVAPSVTDDSLVLFTGRLQKPSTINKKTVTIEARQDFGAINVELPYSKFLATDPNGRLPSDPLFEGFRFISHPGTYITTQKVPSTSFFGRLFGKSKNVNVTNQWSSLDDTPYGSSVPEVFGSCQMPGIPIFFTDTGYWTWHGWVWCKGPISAINNFKIIDQLPAGAGVFTQNDHLGDLGGTGTNAIDSPQNPGGGKYSFTAFTGLTIHQPIVNGVTQTGVITNSPKSVALIRGRIIDVPDNSGVYNQSKWTDNPVHIARYILTAPRFVNIDPAFMEDAVNFLTSLHCDGPLIDDSDDQVILIPSVDLSLAGDVFFRYQSTGIFNGDYWRYHKLGDLSIVPEAEDGPYTSFDIYNPPTTQAVTQKLLRKRYTCSTPITDSTKAIDFLYDVVFTTAKLFMRVNKNGKYEIRSEQAADSTRLRAATAVGDVAIPILDVTPWKSGPELLKGRVLLGVDLTTSEVRDVSSADYSSAGNAVTLSSSATGGTTATASGANLTGGSTSVRASGTVTLTGSPGAGDVITVTIAGVVVTYTVTDNDDINTAAAMLAGYIAATELLNKFVDAVWDPASPTVVAIKAKYGTLNISSALLKAHTLGVGNPGSAPTIAATGSGTMAAGNYQLAYCDVTAVGRTALTPIATVTLAANQQIAISSLPAFPPGVTSRDFFLNDEVNGSRLRYVVSRTNASNFNLNAMPLPNAALPPVSNTTAEELVRVAMSFATNSQDLLPAWAPGALVSITEIRLPATPNNHKYQASAVTTGLTGSTEPTWPTGAGSTVVDGGVTWTEIGETVLAQAGLTRANVLADSFNWPLGSEQSSINQIEISYRDRKNDFALTPYRINDYIHQAQVGKPYPMKVDGSAIDSFNQMYRIANWLLSKYRDGDWFDTLGTGPQGMVLEEGDVICSSDDSGGLINVLTRIEKLTISPKHEVTVEVARRYSTDMFSDQAIAHTIPVPSVFRDKTIAAPTVTQVGASTHTKITLAIDDVQPYIVKRKVRVADDSGMTTQLLVTITPNSFIEAAFAGCLVRDPSDEEMQTWRDGLKSAGDTSPSALVTEAASLVKALFQSAEYTARARNDGEFVNDCYRAYLNRPADGPGYAGWLAALGGGSTRSDVEDGFGGSAEFSTRSQENPWELPSMKDTLPRLIDIQRMDSGAGTKTVYVRVSHSSGGAWGDESAALAITFADNGGAGGTSGSGTELPRDEVGSLTS